jgi:dihydrofolate reductase
MGHVIVIEYITLDGVIEDPDGSQGTARGGWAFPEGPPAVAEDKFHLGPLMESGVLLLGRQTWEIFAARWPNRSGDFPTKMNEIPKVVATRSRTAVDEWQGSSLLDGPLDEAVRTLRDKGDVIVTGSISVVRALQLADLVDEYRLLVVPIALGSGVRLFPATDEAQALELVSVEQTGQASLVRYARGGGPRHDRAA